MTERNSALAALLAKQQITERIVDYCRGVDRGDRELLGSVFWPKATIDHPPFQGHAEEFCDAALEFIALTDVAMHSLSNIRIEIDGDRAYTEAHFTAYHRLRAGLGARGMIAELLCPHHRDDIDEDHFIGGRYIKWFERRGDEWRVCHHIGFPEWERWEPAADRTTFPRLGRRDRSDPSYRRG
ncbi:MAG: nuclear transport factor 2 family protein [Steroidobacteraceae bacterium]